MVGHNNDSFDIATDDPVMTTIKSVRPMPFTQKILRLSLRLRQIVLPWSISIATIGVLLSDSLSTKNILLNFLAVTFLVEADNMLAKVLFSSKQQDFVERVLFDDERIRSKEVSVSCLWPKLSGFVVAILVVVCVYGISALTKIGCKNCHRLSKILVVLSYVGSSSSGFLWSIWQMRRKRVNSETFHTYLLEFARGHSAIIFKNLLTFCIAIIAVLETSAWKKKYMYITFYSIASLLSFVIMEIVVEKCRKCVDRYLYFRISLIAYWLAAYGYYLWTIKKAIDI